MGAQAHVAPTLTMALKCRLIAFEFFLGILLHQKDLEELERFSRNANHHDHNHDHDHEDIFDRAARVGIRVFDGKDREGADDLGNGLDFFGGHR